MILELPTTNEPEELQRAMCNEVKQWNQLGDTERRHVKTRFMNRLGMLYISVFQFHPDKAEAFAKELIKIDREAVLTIGTEYANESYDAVRVLMEWGDHWEVARVRRTNLAAFDALFGELFVEKKFGNFFEDFEEWLDERRDAVTTLKAEDVSKNVPDGHWWWYRD